MFLFHFSVFCLNSRGNSVYLNLGVISSCSPLIPLMIFLMKVTSLQNTGCKVLLYGTERWWPEETSLTHFWTAVNTDSPPGSAATHAKIDVQSWQTAQTAIYVARWCLAMWGVQTPSRTISPHSMGLLPHLTRGNYLKKIAFFQTVHISFNFYCIMALGCGTLSENIVKLRLKNKKQKQICLNVPRSQQPSNTAASVLSF